MDYLEVPARSMSMSPPGGLIAVDELALTTDQVAWFGDDDTAIAVDKDGRPAVVDAQERVVSRWNAQRSTPEMFEVLGTLPNLQQGCVATGSSDNWLLLTNSHLRVTCPWFKSQVRTMDGVVDVPYGSVFAFVVPLLDIELIDGNKNDIAVATALDGLRVTWVRAVDDSWVTESRKNPWHRDNTAFARAVLDAVVAVKAAHTDPTVRASGERVHATDTSLAFATRRRTTFEFSAP